MKRLFLIIFYLFLLNETISSQIIFYDSVSVIASSASYDFKNPVFDNIKNSINTHVWITYERHIGEYSDIIVRDANYNGFGPEINLTGNADHLNLNPSINNIYLVWQSNQRGNWDLYFSVFSNNSYWSSPFIIDSTSADETSPNILINNSSAGNFFIVYKKNSNIGFKRYNTISLTWDKDTILTSGDSVSAPILFNQPTSTGFCIAYIKYVSPENSKLYLRLFDEPSSGIITWHEPVEVNQISSPNNLSSSFTGVQYITYSYDTLGNKNIVGSISDGGTLKEVFSKNIPGNHYFGKGSLMGNITDDPYFHFSVFSCLTKSNDSSQVTFINRPGSLNNNPQYKKIYLGDSGVTTKLDLSAPLFQFSSGGPYRIRAVWEKNIGGKIGLVESYMTDILSGVSNQNLDLNNFYLSQNYPNPFNPSTVIRYTLIQNGFVSLKVFDVLGNEVATLVNEKQNAGNYEVEFNGENLSSGVYFYKITTGSFSQTRKMFLTK